MSRANIIIAGDSWACGEWSNNNNNYGISHFGLTKHLIDDYQVINLSQPGGANRGNVDRIANFLELNPHLPVTDAIVFQTEWIRDIFIEEPDILADDLKNGYCELKNRLLSRFYQKLSKASLTYNVSIHIVGGCSDAIWLDRFAEEYPGLQISCQSLTNLLINNDHRTLTPVHALFTKRKENEVDYIKRHFNNTDLKLLLNDIDLGHQRLNLWRENKEYFWPDGAHANQLGHQVLFNFLKTKINI